jgi:hypothetical protein
MCQFIWLLHNFTSWISPYTLGFTIIPKVDVIWVCTVHDSFGVAKWKECFVVLMARCGIFKNCVPVSDDNNGTLEMSPSLSGDKGDPAAGRTLEFGEEKIGLKSSAPDLIALLFVYFTIGLVEAHFTTLPTKH